MLKGYTTPPIPDAAAFLALGDSIKPLHYPSSTLKTLISELQSVPVSQQSAEKLMQLQSLMQKPEWATAHDAAHEALNKALSKISTDNSLASHIPDFEALYKSRLPAASTLAMIKNDALQAELKPLADYLSTFAKDLTPLVTLNPKHIIGLGITTTAAAHVASIENAFSAATGLTGKPRALHMGTTSLITPEHVHDEHCGHLHSGSVFASKPPKKDITSHAPASSSKSVEASTASIVKSSHGKWALAGAGAVAASGFLLNQYGASNSNAIQKEAEKSDEKRAEDIAYTLNHAISCATTDVLIAPTISALFGVNVGCSDPTHNHGAHDHNGRHDHKGYTKPPFSWQLYGNEVLHYTKGELIGDAAAVPLTIITQRYLPNVMEGLRKLSEPVARIFFTSGAHRAAAKWGDSQGFASDSSEVKLREKAIYDNEVAHVPQALVWNIFAFPIGVIGQKWAGHSHSIPKIMRNKALGALISNTLLLGSRAIVPDKAEAWDKMNSENIIIPVTKVVGKLFGIDSKAVDNIANASKGQNSWAQHIEAQPNPSTAVER